MELPLRFPCFNSEKALRRLGAYSGDLKKGHLGLGYLDLLNALHAVRLRSGLTDFRDVDQLTFFVTRKGGRDAK